MDVWGQIFGDLLDGERRAVEIERDDGRIETLASAAMFFDAPRLDSERELLGRLEGPVLELGAGAGAYSLFLQQRGLEVVTTDASPGAVEVCRRRGCRDVRLMDLRSLALEPASMGSVVIMGNTLGAHQTPETMPGFLQRLRAAVRPGGRLLCDVVDPLATDAEEHLAYHRRNRERGLPPGLVRLRIRYGELSDEWVWLWMPTVEELAGLIAASGWRLEEERREGPVRVCLFLAA